MHHKLCRLVGTATKRHARVSRLIEFVEVSKYYRTFVPPRTTHALKGLTVTVERGEVFGIAGPNGAGKTTMLALALGFLLPTEGSVRIDGKKPRRYVEKFGVSYLSEIVSVPTWWTVKGALRRYSVLEGISERDRSGRVGDAIAQLGLGEHRNKRIKHLSKGNLQRVGLAQALLSNAELVIFDEPTHGLDPLWTQRFRDIVVDLRREDRAIMIASHNLDELERLADRVAILDRGSLSRIAGTHHAVSGEILHYRLVLAEEHEAVEAAFPGAERLDSPRQVMYDVRGDIVDLNAGLERFLAEGGRVQAFFPARSRLEAAFREAVGEE